ncbi:30S ribosomal protein S8 [Candidatus Azambacteria bacterium]|nr:30S ribosomal protein S8 [Candidatus Azambacteria bacterium]
MTDPIADMLTRIRNAGMVGKPIVHIPYSKIKMAIADVLKGAGFIDSCEKKGKKIRKTIEIKLKYEENGQPRISDLKRISKPSQRIYKGYGELFNIRQGFGLSIISTPMGVMSNKEARKNKVGGELLCEVW